MGRVIAAAVAAAVLVAAGGAAAQDGAPVPYRTLERDDGGSSGYDARTTLVVRTKRRWRHVWGRLHAGVRGLTQPVGAVPFRALHAGRRRCLRVRRPR